MQCLHLFDKIKQVIPSLQQKQKKKRMFLLAEDYTQLALGVWIGNPMNSYTKTAVENCGIVRTFVSKKKKVYYIHTFTLAACVRDKNVVQGPDPTRYYETAASIMF